MLGISLLVMACAIWGFAFAGSRWTFMDYSPIWSHCLRYIFAALIAIPVVQFRRGFTHLKEGLICAVFLMTALQMQTIGVAQTTLAKSGFLTVFYAVFTPILSVLFLKQKLRKSFWLLLIFAMFGMALMCDLKLSGFNRGDVWILVSALFFAIHILVVDHYAENIDPLNFNFIQCIFMGLIAIPLGLLLDGVPNLSPLMNKEALIFPSSLYGFLLLSIFSSLIAFSFQMAAQKRTPAHVVGLIFLSESLFASLSGWIFFDESLTFTQIIGAVIILISVALIPKFASLRKGDLKD